MLTLPPRPPTRSILLKHLKRQIVSTSGGLQLIADLNAYHAFVTSLRQPPVTAYFTSLKMVGEIYLVDSPKDLGALVRDTSRYEGVLSPEDLYELGASALLPSSCPARGPGLTRTLALYAQCNVAQTGSASSATSTRRCSGSRSPTTASFRDEPRPFPLPLSLSPRLGNNSSTSSSRSYFVCGIQHGNEFSISSSLT